MADIQRAQHGVGHQLHYAAVQGPVCSQKPVFIPILERRTHVIEDRPERRIIVRRPGSACDRDHLVLEPIAHVSRCLDIDVSRILLEHPISELGDWRLFGDEDPTTRTGFHTDDPARLKQAEGGVESPRGDVHQ